MSQINPVHSDAAPKAVGPYSQAMRDGELLYLSGQIGLDPASGSLVGDTVEAQARQVMQNLSAVLAAGGSSPDGIIKANIYLVDMADFPKINAIYAEWLGDHRPARATVAVAALPLGAKVEIDLIARISG
jgi:2-iminobutanoate/2-iminopropanoate deaminase